MKQTLLLILTIFLLKGCKTCPNDELPRILLKFSQQNLLQYTEVYNESISFNPQENFNRYFPLSLNLETPTTYLKQ